MPDDALERRRLQTRAGLLEFAVAGEGSPAIVLFNGAGMTLGAWDAVWPSLAAMTRVFAWNRFGIEGSDDPAQVQSGALVSASVRELLGYAGVEPPYVLVGHSLGALYASLFARLHPGDVAGSVFVEGRRPADGPVSPDALPGIERSLAKVQQAGADSFVTNLHAEVDAFAHVRREIDAAGPFPRVPVEHVEATGSHFPQLKSPREVTDAVARVIRASRA